MGLGGRAWITKHSITSQLKASILFQWWITWWKYSLNWICNLLITKLECMKMTFRNLLSEHMTVTMSFWLCLLVNQCTVHFLVDLSWPRILLVRTLFCRNFIPHPAGHSGFFVHISASVSSLLERDEECCWMWCLPTSQEWDSSYSFFILYLYSTWCLDWHINGLHWRPSTFLGKSYNLCGCRSPHKICLLLCYMTSRYCCKSCLSFYWECGEVAWDFIVHCQWSR